MYVCERVIEETSSLFVCCFLFELNFVSHLLA